MLYFLCHSIFNLIKSLFNFAYKYIIIYWSKSNEIIKKMESNKKLEIQYLR